jgi:hypothetical protein
VHVIGPLTGQGSDFDSTRPNFRAPPEASIDSSLPGDLFRPPRV